ncbi:hypothetical protein ABZX90_30115, partial [Streptomyces sp. NPDC002935]|uniref:hypothetical protein n=1 Tax=Streptomyces sp. NPDC002935 TaxID=3154545 RepID=UPI0033BBED3A
LKGDSYRMRGRDLGRVPAANTGARVPDPARIQAPCRPARTHAVLSSRADLGVRNPRDPSPRPA